MNFYVLVVYSIIQGLTEFLPVSSSGHLALLPKILGNTDPGTLFDLWMHLGTAFAVMVYFHKDLRSYIKVIFGSRLLTDGKYPQVLIVRNFALSTFSTLILVLLLKDFSFNIGRSVSLICFNLIFFGILMFLIDRKKNVRKLGYMDKFHGKEALMIGLSQAIAIFPGVSRSGITITAGRAFGLSREESTSYSFLLALPIIIGGIILEMPGYLKDSVHSSVPAWAYVVGVLATFIVGLATIHVFLKLVKKTSLLYFSVYRILLGITLLVVFS